MAAGKWVFEPADGSCLETAVQLTVDEYLAEQKNNRVLYDRDYSKEIAASLDSLFRNGKTLMAYENGTPVGFLGLMVGENTDGEGYKTAWGNIGGYGISRQADRGRVASMLFQYLSEMLLPLKVRDYVINVYAHDTEMIKAFIFNQFNIMCTNEIRNLDVPIVTSKSEGFTFKEFSEKESRVHKETLLQLWRDLANHLRQSPTYYLGAEFTDAAYWEHINAPGTRLWAALDETQQVCGVVDTSHDAFCFAWNDTGTLNVGDLYVTPECRGKGAAQSLLQYAAGVLKQENYRRLWVMHGTANPNALHFWGKYFTPFIYQLTRSIDSKIVDLSQDKQLF